MPTTIEKTCLECGRTFQAPLKEHNRGNGKFCSQSCSSKNAGRNKKRNLIEFTCATCHIVFYRSPSRVKKSKSGIFFCSRACKDKAQRVGGIKEIMPSHYGTGESRYRERALEFYGEICDECGFDKDTSILEAHHRDYNHNNNKIKNLRILCRNCHGQVHMKARREREHLARQALSQMS